MLNAHVTWCVCYAGLPCATVASHRTCHGSVRPIGVTIVIVKGSWHQCLTVSVCMCACRLLMKFFPLDTPVARFLLQIQDPRIELVFELNAEETEILTYQR